MIKVDMCKPAKRLVAESGPWHAPSLPTADDGGSQHLLGEFLAEGYLDELFLTLAPQIAGRGSNLERLGLVAGKVFAPDHSVWAKLLSLKRAGEHLFLRYAFDTLPNQENR